MLHFFSAQIGNTSSIRRSRPSGILEAMDGIHLMATALHAAKARLDVSAANLANVSSDGFRKSVGRATLTRDGLVASARIDTTPGPLRRTARSFDLTTAGAGGFFVRTPGGPTVEVRSKSFDRDARGHLVDERGNVLLGTHGPLVVREDATIDARGDVHEAGTIVARIAARPGTALQSGFLESANVDSVREMVDVLGEQRAFETAQKTLAALDDERQKDANDVIRIKG
jgi:flagellar basal-body rod protein FlgF